ncbi:universal stress protein [Mycobacterium kansasii]|uniref:Universal stress protein n=1 Tax=Mycobacterium kansasii TaxID=1768 RepID=A0A1V3WYS2_MYCKA|nr:universal stress protein [Mycobacterium kansasii]
MGSTGRHAAPPSTDLGSHGECGRADVARDADVDGMAAWQEEDGRQVLEQAVKIAEQAVQAHREITIHTELRWSPPVPTLVELSAEAELVVVGSYGRGAVARAVLGSVGSALLRRATCPVAVVRDPDPAADPAHPAQLPQAPVVVGIDGSPVSELATAIAFDEASRRGVELKAVHAWSDLEVVDLPGLDWSTVKAEAEQTVAERLAGWQERYPDVTVHRLVVCDRPARELIDQAQTAQLVVLGSHGRGDSPACCWVRSAMRWFTRFGHR